MIVLHDTGYFHYHQRVHPTVAIVAGALVLVVLLFGGWWFGKR